MKKCPQCGRGYNDDSMSFCLDDGFELLFGPASMDEPATAILAGVEARTQEQITVGVETAILPGNTGASGNDVRISKTFKLAVLTLVILSVVGAIGYGAYRYLSKAQGEKTQRTGQEIKTQRLTGDGRSGTPVISPDGKFLVFTKLEGAKQSLWIKQVEATSSVNVVKPGEFEEFFGIAFSPDGNFVYFNAENKSPETPTIYRVPTLGGTPTKFLANASRLGFSADGNQIAFLNIDRDQDSSSVLVANADGSNGRVLASRSGAQAFWKAPAWSPDSKFLAVAAIDDSLAPAPNFYVVLISIADGSFSEIGSRRWEGIDGVVWHPSGDSLIVVASDNSFLPGQVWELPYPSAAYRRVTNSLNGYDGISITADGRSIVTVEADTRSAIWVSPDLKPENAKAVTSANGDIRGLAWTPDGKIVYSSNQTGDSEIWMMNADGSDARPLTSDKVFKFDPTVSSDGKFIVYTTSQNGGQLMRMDIGGGNPVMLTKYNNSVEGNISPDGKWVIHYAYVDGAERVVRVPLAGGETQILTDFSAITPSYSNDGAKFACFLTDGARSLAIVSAEGGKPIKVMKLPPETITDAGLFWTPDDKGIVVNVQAGEKSNLWLVPVDGGEAKQITNFESSRVFHGDYSRSGKRIGLVRGDFVSNAIMMTGFR
ncbi:MAG: hypothetical protein ABIU09_13370 [Pyrinomonadaceae bacterium]